MSCSFRASKLAATGALALLAAAVTATAFSTTGPATGSRTEILKSVDTKLCPFHLGVTVTRKTRTERRGKTTFELVGPTTIVLKNLATGLTKTLDAQGTYSLDETTGSIVFSGHQLWFFATGKHVPFLFLNGHGSMAAPTFAFKGSSSNDGVVDACALVAPSPISVQPVVTPAPWKLPVDALGQMRFAHITPLLANLVRHDHVHLDIVVNRARVKVPAGIGLAEPTDTGPCPHGAPPQGDCATHNFYAGQVANSPIHTHSSSGIIHVESDLPRTFTLGQFFDEWGVRFETSCLGSYCTGGGEQLRVYVDGKYHPRNPRAIVLTNEQEIAVIYGKPGDFASAPSRYTGGWPGGGCGGTGEPLCFPR